MPPDTSKTVSWSPRAKLLVSGLILLQLLAVLAEPLHFLGRSQVRGTSFAFRPLRSAMAPYVEFAYLNHGYAFFAPDPGPAHLLQCNLSLPGGQTASLRYPDKKAQWPRLLYHRHFMLSEFLNQLHVPPVDPVAVRQLSAEEAAEWATARKRYEMVRQSMETHLQARFVATAASIERVRHILPGSDVVLEQNLPLNDPSLYLVLPDQPSVDGAADLPQPPLIYRPIRSGEKVEVGQ
jgi:hypothetical protein